MQVLNLDLSEKRLNHPINAKQLEVGRKFAAILTDNAVPYVPEKSSVFTVWYKSENSGSGNYSQIGGRDAVVLENNVAVVELIPQMLINAGPVELCLVINSAEGRQIGFWNINCIVEEIPGSGSDEATEYYTALSETAGKAIAAAERAEASAETVIEEIAKRTQLKPEFANSIDECTDTTKLYVLPDGYIYAYMQYRSAGSTNLADPSSDEWQEGYRYNSSHALTTASDTGAFVSNYIPCQSGDVIRIKGVKDSDSTASAKAYLRIAGYKEDGSQLSKAPYLTRNYASVAAAAAYGVELSDDGTYTYTLMLIHSGENSSTQLSENIAAVRVAGCYAGTADNVIITINEEISEGSIVTGWANTGHAFVPADYEDRIAGLEDGQKILGERIASETAALQEQIDSGAAAAKSGARWFALGDSITEGWIGYINDEGNGACKVGDTNACWAALVAGMNGYELTNHGIGGTGYLQGTTNARVLVDTLDFSQCDFVTLAYGVNDWKYAVNIGSLDDDIAEGGSMVANMRYVIKKILADNPMCKIFVITPINCKCSNYCTYDTNWGINVGEIGLLNGYGLADIFELMQAVCKYHGVELIDMTYSSCVNRENLTAVLPDGIHPTVAGHKLMARELAQKIHFR